MWRGKKQEMIPNASFNLLYASFQPSKFFTLYPSIPRTRERQHVPRPNEVRSPRQATNSGVLLDSVTEKV